MDPQAKHNYSTYEEAQKVLIKINNNSGNNTRKCLKDKNKGQD